MVSSHRYVIMDGIKEKFSNLIKDQNLEIFDGPFVVKNFLKNVEDYLNWNILNEAINNDVTNCRLIEKKSTVPILEIPWSRTNFAKVEINPNQNKQYFLDHVNNGTTFIIEKCGLLNDNFKSLVSGIQETFPFACEIKIFGSKGTNSKSFTPHTDRINNFIIQAIGDTDWVVFKNRISNILPFSNYINYEPKKGELTPALEVTLSPGDLLYIPPRAYHVALPSMPRLSMSIPCISIDNFDLSFDDNSMLDQSINLLPPDVKK